ncbi:MULTISPECIES: ATP-binding cassette domain-containing protein [unclassified Saccharopolyspora]|uniref:ATP-binding cassette domain-containing protein n=1 Tax=unclassified Saccharopolyspora TaxID=2646250 RepID=UPI001CD66584|nr:MULTISPECIES: ATP-binding cassette domain-containing protein [unclassified Saccharopolyspora]MCA1185146.1 ATP-binding cassette domain-containing protein [Saccharopolyspora sp. 6T]MCA1191378.1 ATP-binding cassette domain-containing protein [Saccharopolyspora sp. 6V]MCA1225021.1 ATP-binding cassette domain-containing protein [Saccharopolyspora sp. 6M]MCA1278488.1 ATP-binding cassette domain-containing protein [Saccharopolyspora sp. 7B]
MSQPVIEAHHLTKTFGTVTALDDVCLSVDQGTVLGMLGHNGAGKTTLVNILSTLLPPSSGTARVAGYDVTRHRAKVCARIGLTGQFASVDEQLSGVDNLVLIGRLLGARKAEARQRAAELLDVFDLTGAATRLAGTYSGGMRRRLDLAASLVGDPDVIFLDEPTTGLDPTSRLGMWEIVEALVERGTTVLLTTQYLNEADRLADSIAVLSQGRVVAAGTPGELKAEVGQRSVTTTLSDPADADTALRALTSVGLPSDYDAERHQITTSVTASRELGAVVRALDEARVEVAALGLGEPTLDDVYLAHHQSTERAQPVGVPS